MSRKVDHTNTRCSRCGSYKSYVKGIDLEGKEICDWRTDKYRKGGWDGKSYLCSSCDRSSRYQEKERSNPNSYCNMRKSHANCRTGNLDRFENHGKEVIGQWVIAKTLGVRDLNIDNNNFMEPVDLSRHSVHGMIDVKTCTLRNIGMIWQANVKRQNFDTAIILCMDRYELWRNVDRVYIIPNDKIWVSSCLTIYKDLPERFTYQEEFRVDENPYNNVYHSVDIPRFFSPWDLWNGKYNNDE